MAKDKAAGNVGGVRKRNAAGKKPASKTGRKAAAKHATRSCVPGTHAKWVVEPDGSRTEYVWDENCEPVRKSLYGG
jgi:hypothetical protein